MTPAPHWIGAGQACSEAQSMMREHRIRHLPVLRQARLVGVVSERDLALVQSLPGMRPEALPVEEAMTDPAYTVAADTPLPEVARVMATRKFGSAVVMDGDEVVGVFTTTDALRALADLLEGAEQGSLRQRITARARAR